MIIGIETSSRLLLSISNQILDLCWTEDRLHLNVLNRSVFSLVLISSYKGH